MVISLIMKNMLVTKSIIVNEKSSIRVLFTIYNYYHMSIDYRMPEEVYLTDEKHSCEEPLEYLWVLYRLMLFIRTQTVDDCVRDVEKDLSEGNDCEVEIAPPSEIVVERLPTAPL